jgi:hypothetical protein
MGVHPTVTASTMIADLNCGGKVRCHNGSVDFRWNMRRVVGTLTPHSRAQEILRSA